MNQGKEYKEYLDILPSDTLKEALASAGKVEKGKMKREECAMMIQVKNRVVVLTMMIKEGRRKGEC